MTKEERNKICLSCTNHIIDERYGVLCKLTNNLPNFQGSCKYYNKKMIAESIYNSTPKSTKSIPKKKKGFGSIFGIGISIYLVFKLVLLIIKFLTN